MNWGSWYDEARSTGFPCATDPSKRSLCLSFFPAKHNRQELRSNVDEPKLANHFLSPSLLFSPKTQQQLSSLTLNLWKITLKLLWQRTHLHHLHQVQEFILKPCQTVFDEKGLNGSLEGLRTYSRLWNQFSPQRLSSTWHPLSGVSDEWTLPGNIYNLSPTCRHRTCGWNTCWTRVGLIGARTWTRTRGDSWGWFRDLTLTFWPKIIFNSSGMKTYEN